jgi:hypothetical protein
MFHCGKELLYILSSAILWKAEFKGDTLINLMEEILNQHAGFTWVLFTAFTQIYNEYWEQKEEKDFKTLQFGQKNPYSG